MFSRSLSSGLPLGVTITDKEIMDLDPCSHDNTLGGNFVACSVALAVIDAIRSEHLLENAAKQGNYILKRLRELAEKYQLIGDVRGKGLMIGFEIVKELKKREPGIAQAQQIVNKSFRRGVLCTISGSYVIQLTPPLNIISQLVDRGLEI